MLYNIRCRKQEQIIVSGVLHGAAALLQDTVTAGARSRDVHCKGRRSGLPVAREMLCGCTPGV